MSYKHTYKSKMYVLEKDLVDVDVMEPVDGKVVALIDPIIYDPDVMGIVGQFKPGKPLMKVVLPADLVDDESVEVIGNLQSVWCDPQIEFNGATMDYVVWENKESNRHSKGISIQIPDVSGIISDSLVNRSHGHIHEGFHRITKNRTINDLYIGCLVEQGVELTVKGDNYSSLRMLKVSELSLKAIIMDK